MKKPTFEHYLMILIAFQNYWLLVSFSLPRDLSTTVVFSSHMIATFFYCLQAYFRLAAALV
jgi:hypothetical protein